MADKAAAAEAEAARVAKAAAEAEALRIERKTHLRRIDQAVQDKWARERVYEANPDPSRPKYFVTFPYPYMNGRLHLGHGFSLSKSEFAARFMRLKGRNVLWPFGLHVTGTPIAACAQKLANEMRQFGTPPVFPKEFLEEKEAAASAASESQAAAGRHTGRRGKVATSKPQWCIMEGMSIPPAEIPPFAQASYWLEYFPPRAIEDLKLMGCHIDYRRSFITTPANPYYDSFVRWQFRHLRDRGCLGFGKRYCVFSPLDDQPCADHDRASGEGVGPQEYTCVKLRVQNPSAFAGLAAFASIIGDKPVVLPGATLRPETVVGQTNCWISPKIRYAAFEIVAPGGGAPEIFIMTTRAARNMAFQGITVNGSLNNGNPTPLFEVDGADIIGLPLSSPGSPYATIYTLPMETISDTKGTGVVMSVPSDSPDDYINFTQLLAKPEYRAKLHLRDEWVVPFAIVPIIEIPEHEFGRNAAEVACAKLKVQSPKDAVQLEEAKKQVYQAGFYQGVMICGPFQGEKVAVAKVKMTEMMIKNGDALKYFEPMKQVTSRSGDECVVALCDQWFIEYGKEEWRAAVEKHMLSMEMYYPGIRNGFEETLKWLADWPCSRTFGLGTCLPFEDAHKVIIDSLSDSTIYMAYYTVAKHIHAAADGSENLDGTKDNAHGLRPEMFDHAMWDFLMLGRGSAAEHAQRTGAALTVVEDMRREFEYFYPVDLRVSAKDLIPNHLTMFLYNHAAIWPDDTSKWPRSIFCNGHILVNGDKMSKSKGNFIVLRDAIEEYSADCTRLAVADAGDSLDDANFVTETAKGFTSKLVTWVEVFQDKHAKLATMRNGELSLFDRIFENAINDAIVRADDLYSRMQYRAILNSIFFEFTGEESQYRVACGAEGPHRAVIARFMDVFCLLMTPLAPHVTEHIWTIVLGHSESIMLAAYPKPSAPVSLALRMAFNTVTNLAAEIRQQVQKASKKKTAAAAATVSEIAVYVAPAYHPWQRQSLTLLSEFYHANGKVFPKDLTKQLTAKKEAWMTPELLPEIMAFIAYAKMLAERYGPEALALEPLNDDALLLREAMGYLQSQTGVSTIHVFIATDESIAEHKNARAKARPGEPTVAAMPEPKK